jgi:hypothetical protein
MSYFYSEPSLIRPPSVPNVFDERAEKDGDGHPDAPPNAARILIPGMFKANCVLSELFYAIMTFNTTNPVMEGEDPGSAQRAEFYVRLTKLQEAWDPILLRSGVHFTAQTCYLR